MTTCFADYSPKRTSPDNTERDATRTLPPTTQVASKIRVAANDGFGTDDRRAHDCTVFDDRAGQEYGLLKHDVGPDDTVSVHRPR